MNVARGTWTLDFSRNCGKVLPANDVRTLKRMSPGTSALGLAPEPQQLPEGAQAQPTCKQRYREFIDLDVLSRSAAAGAVPGSFADYTYGLKAQYPFDHCPVSVAISTC